ncbi:TPA: hypothetical protein ACN4AN_004180 [Vibrio parahaemolyticus]
MNNKYKRKAQLENNAKNQILKSQQLDIYETIKRKLLDSKNEKLRTNIKLRDKMKMNLQNPSTKFLDMIDEQQEFLDELSNELASDQAQTLISNDKARQLISELRLVDPRKADELENSLNLKQTTQKSRTITKKRIQ